MDNRSLLIASATFSAVNRRDAPVPGVAGLDADLPHAFPVDRKIGHPTEGQAFDGIDQTSILITPYLWPVKELLDFTF